MRACGAERGLPPTARPRHMRGGQFVPFDLEELGECIRE